MYALELAEAVVPDGTIDLVDDQPRLLEVAMRRARERGLANVTGVFADVRYLPFDDGTFDAAYLAVVIPNAMHPCWYGCWSFSGRFMWSVAPLWRIKGRSLDVFRCGPRATPGRSQRRHGPTSGRS